jgi:hypothetical protein
MSRLRRLVISRLSAAVALGARVYATVRERGRWSCAAEGYRIVLPVDSQCPATGRACAVCAAQASVVRTPNRSIRLVGAALPALTLALCAACWRRILRVQLQEASVACCSTGLAFSSGLLCCWLFPWVSASVLTAVIAAAAGAGLGLRLLFRVPQSPVCAWRGVPASWVNTRQGLAVLETPCEGVLEAVRLQQLPALGSCVARVVEHHAVRARICAVVSVLMAAPLTWLFAHPEVRVANVSDTAVVVSVDGRTLGAIDAVAGEAPNAAHRFRVPWGTHRFEARALSGAVVDRTQAYVGREGPMLYAPAGSQQCFWLESRGYGRLGRPEDTVVALEAGRAFVQLPREVDSWFQPNPADRGRSDWLSGGERTTVRHGPCERPVPTGN